MFSKVVSVGGQTPNNLALGLHLYPPWESFCVFVSEKTQEDIRGY